MPVASTPFRFTVVHLALVTAMSIFTLAPASVSAQAEPEFFERPYAPNQWELGKRLDESKLRYCVDPRDPDWEVAAAIADAIAQGLLLEPVRYTITSEQVQEDITKVYALLLEHCDIQMGFKLISGGYAGWASVTRPYYEAAYVLVALDPDVNALADLGPGRPIGASMGTSAHVRLVTYLTALPAEERWPTYPMSSNDAALNALVNGTVDVALVWAPTLWSRQRGGDAIANLRVIDPNPLPPTSLGVGALLLSQETFLRAAVDETIAALTADGTIAGILEQYDFPAKVSP